MPLGAKAQSLEAISGPTHGKPGDTLTFVVEARDSDGNPQSGVEVLFGKSPSDDTSKLRPYDAGTGVDGRTKTTLILKKRRHRHIPNLGVAHRQCNFLTVIFNVMVDAAPPPTTTTTTTTEPLPEPTTLEIISGDGQEGVAGTVLVDPFVVEVRDEDTAELLRRSYCHVCRYHRRHGRNGCCHLKDRFRRAGGEYS